MNIFGTSFDYQKRLEKMRKLMGERGLDAVLVHLWTNQYYLSGMYQHSPWYPLETGAPTETPLIVFADKAREPVFLCAYLTSNGLKEGTWITDVRVVDKEPLAKRTWWENLAEVLREKGVDAGTIGIEEEVCVVSTFEKMKSALPKARFKAADDIFQLLRIVKDADEIRLIRESVSVAEAGMKAGMEVAKVGVPESEVQKAVEIEMKRRGAIREVETMVQSGKRTANHRAFGANWKKIEDGDLVMIDVGCVYKGYGSDLTRTWAVGKPNEMHRKIARDLRKVHEKVLAFMKPGLAIRDIYQLANADFGAAGYLTDRTIMPSGDTGTANVTIHGIGAGPMHDPPHPWERDVVLEAGMTLAVAGGARFASFTIRNEDNVVVTDRGIDFIATNIPWEL
jgi:Xaa-Pro dipeptidase